jgi:cobalt-zinc-cadmium efflux system membrane fusion protein
MRPCFYLFPVIGIFQTVVLIGCGTGAPSSTEASSSQAAQSGELPLSLGASGGVALPPTDGIVRVPPVSRQYIAVEAVDSQTSNGVVRAPGRVAFRDKAVSSVGAPVAGRVLQARVQVGDRVRAGDPLVTLSSPSAAGARAELAHARVEIQSAKELVKRQSAMLQRGVGLEFEKFEADMRLKGAQAELERASKVVASLGEGTGERVTIRAPIDGTVLQRTATVGATVDPGGQPLVEIGDPSALWVVTDVFERDLPLVRAGAEATVELASVPNPIHGRVAAVGAAVDAELRRAPVYVALEEQGLSLRPGMYGHVTINAASSQGVMVPVTAVLIKDGKRNIVYVENGDGAFVPRDVIIGQSVEGRVQVISGITPGERVVVRGALLLDGAAEQLL